MEAAERDQVAQIGAAALQPVLQVVSVRPPPRDRAARKTAAPVPRVEIRAQPRRDSPPREAEVDRQSLPLPELHHLGIAGQPLCHRGRQCPPILQRAATALCLAAQQRGIDVNHHPSATGRPLKL